MGDGGAGVAAELERLAARKGHGVIADADFAQQKAKLLGESGGAHRVAATFAPASRSRGGGSA